MKLNIRWILGGLVVMGIVYSASADVPKRALAAMEVKAYCVADLLVPADDATTAPILRIWNRIEQVKWETKKLDNAEDVLIAYLTASVSTGEWEANGGNCSLRYEPEGMSIVVTASPKVHAQVGQALHTLRTQTQMMKLDWKLVQQLPEAEDMVYELPTNVFQDETSTQADQPLDTKWTVCIKMHAQVLEDEMVEVVVNWNSQYRAPEAGGDVVRLKRPGSCQASYQVKLGETVRVALDGQGLNNAPATADSLQSWALEFVVRPAQRD